MYKKVAKSFMKKAGWWAINQDGKMINPPVNKNKFLNAIPSVDPNEGQDYLGDGPLDHAGDLLEKIDAEYRIAWGRSPTETELKQLWSRAIISYLENPQEFPLSRFNVALEKALGIPYRVISYISKERIEEWRESFSRSEEEEKWAEDVKMDFAYYVEGQKLFLEKYYNTKTASRKKVAFFKKIKELLTKAKDNIVIPMKRFEFNDDKQMAFQKHTREFYENSRWEDVTDPAYDMVEELKGKIYSSKEFKSLKSVGERSDIVLGLGYLEDSLTDVTDNRNFEKVRKNLFGNPLVKKALGKELLSKYEKEANSINSKSKKMKENFRESRKSLVKKFSEIETFLDKNKWKVNRNKALNITEGLLDAATSDTDGLIDNLLGINDVKRFVAHALENKGETFEEFIAKHKNDYFKNPDYDPKNPRMKKEIKLTSMDKEDQKELYEKSKSSK